MNIDCGQVRDILTFQALVKNGGDSTNKGEKQVKSNDFNLIILFSVHKFKLASFLLFLIFPFVFRGVGECNNCSQHKITPSAI